MVSTKFHNLQRRFLLDLTLPKSVPISGVMSVKHRFAFLGVEVLVGTFNKEKGLVEAFSKYCESQKFVDISTEQIIETHTGHT